MRVRPRRSCRASCGEVRAASRSSSPRPLRRLGRLGQRTRSNTSTIRGFAGFNGGRMVDGCMVMVMGVISGGREIHDTGPRGRVRRSFCSQRAAMTRSPSPTASARAPRAAARARHRFERVDRRRPAAARRPRKPPTRGTFSPWCRRNCQAGGRGSGWGRRCRRASVGADRRAARSRYPSARVCDSSDRGARRCSGRGRPSQG